MSKFVNLIVRTQRGRPDEHTTAWSLSKRELNNMAPLAPEGWLASWGIICTSSPNLHEAYLEVVRLGEERR